MIQGSQEWHEARLGKVTCSQLENVLPGVKGKYLAGRADYMMDLALETITGEPTEYFVSKDMEWGTETEPQARMNYQGITGNWVEEVGFIDHPTIHNFGGSPDGVITPDGGLEIKCPKKTTHITTKRTGKIARKYILQMHGCMMVTGAKWWDFESYDPRLPGKLSYWIHRIDIDLDMQKTIEFEVRKFNAELIELVEWMRGNM